MTLGELADDDASRSALMATALGYTQSNGTVSLRDAIAGLYPGATRDHVQVTNGGSEANYITTWNLVEAADSKRRRSRRNLVGTDQKLNDSDALALSDQHWR